MEEDNRPTVLDPDSGESSNPEANERPAEILDGIARDLVPQFLSITSWPENIKKEFVSQLYKSMVRIHLFIMSR